LAVVPKDIRGIVGDIWRMRRFRGFRIRAVQQGTSGREVLDVPT